MEDCDKITMTAYPQYTVELPGEVITWVETIFIKNLVSSYQHHNNFLKFHKLKMIGCFKTFDLATNCSIYVALDVVCLQRDKSMMTYLLCWFRFVEDCDEITMMAYPLC